MTVLESRDLARRVALITGASGGIGTAFVEAFAAAGASVAACDLPGTPLKELLVKVDNPERHTASVANISVPEAVASLIDEVVDAHGRIDILVNSAAILDVSSFLDLSFDAWKEVLAVNLGGTFLIGQAVAQQMVRQGDGGRILAVASNVGRIPRINNAAYATSKAGVIHLVRAMALELAQYDITVNALCPGSTATPMLIDVQAKGNPSLLHGIIHGSIELWRTGIPLGRLAEPADQAAMAVYLASEAGRHITGQAICVDGGQTLF